MIELIILFVAVGYWAIFVLPKSKAFRTPYQHKAPDLAAADLALYRFNKHQYLNSPEWRRKRLAALSRAHYSCEMCHASTNLHVHHVSYKNLYREKPQDLVCVCPSCHTKIHEKHGYPSSLKDYHNFHGPINSFF